MKASKQIMVEMSELREKLHKEMAAEIPEDAPETKATLGKLIDAEARFRQATEKEEREAEARADGQFTSEDREWSSLEKRCSVVPFLAEAATGNKLSGAEDEYRSEFMGSSAGVNRMPITMLAPREERAVTPVAAGTGSTSQADIIPRIFTRNLAPFLGIPMPSVPMGTRTYPIFSTGTTVSMQSPSGEQDAVAGSFTTHELSPVRLTGSYQFRVEDTHLLRGYEEALRNDLRMAISDQMDDQIINGNGTAPNVAGFFNELTAPTDATTRMNYALFEEAFEAGVDGREAFGTSDICAVIGSATYQRAVGQYRANNTDDNAYYVMKDRSGGIRVSSRIPAVASKDQQAIFVKKSFPTMWAVAPVWDSVELIRDPYTNAKSGEVFITMLTLWNFKILREGAAYLRDFQINA